MPDGARALGCSLERVARRQDGVVAAGVALFGRDVANAAVTMLDVVPVHEAGGPGASSGEVGLALTGELRAVLGGAEN